MLLFNVFLHVTWKLAITFSIADHISKMVTFFYMFWRFNYIRMQYFPCHYIFLKQLNSEPTTHIFML